MPDILAIVSKAIFERDGKLGDEPIEPGDIWPVDRYTSNNKLLAALNDGGRLFLVTVRPPNGSLHTTPRFAARIVLAAMAALTNISGRRPSAGRGGGAAARSTRRTPSTNGSAWTSLMLQWTPTQG